MAVFGDTLRQARAHKGVTLREAEQKTRINRHHLLALEEERFHELPALIYQRGIVKNYGTYLELDPNKLLVMFEDARGVEPGDLEPLIQERPPIDVPQHFTPNFAIIAFLVVMSAVVFAWMYSVYFAPAGATSTPTQVVATVTPLKADSMFAPSPIIVQPTATPNPAAAAQVASPTSKPTREAAATATSTKKAVVDAPTKSANANIVPVNGNSGNASAANASSSGTNAASDNSNSVVSGNVSAGTTQTPTLAAGQISLDFVASGDISALTIVVDGSTIWDHSLASGDATGYITGTNFEVHVSDPSLLLIYKDGKKFQMSDTTFSLP